MNEEIRLGCVVINITGIRHIGHFKLLRKRETEEYIYTQRERDKGRWKERQMEKKKVKNR